MYDHFTFAKKSGLSSTVFFVDFDGTMFTPNQKLITAPFYNVQTGKLLKKYNIPLIVVTGRSTWTQKSDIETMLLGLPKPDAVVAGAGSIIYYRLPNGQLSLDTDWENRMSETVIQWRREREKTWNRETVLETIRPLLPANIAVLPNSADTYLIRLYAKQMPMEHLMELKKTIEMHFMQGIKVILTEKLLQPNTLEVFSGNILIVPETAGKENAVKYLLGVIDNKARHASTKEIFQAYCFGDATIDIPMLTLKSEPGKFDMHTYGVNLTPLAKKTLQGIAEINPQLSIVESPHSPHAILEVAKTNFLSLRERPALAGVREETTSRRDFSPAQNNPSRLLIRPFESLLDKSFDKKLSANEISFKGLAMVKQSTDLLYDKHTPNIFAKLNIWKLYTVGNVTDIFDGIRARQTNTISNEGQLTDVFCDRAKEFYQVYKRGEHIITKNEKRGYQTFLTAISCILPSIARAQAEMSGTIVKENDAKGGSMLSRTRKLFSAFFFETLGNQKKSSRIDQQIYEANLATFQNRIQSIHSFPLHSGEGLRVRGETSKNPEDNFNVLQQKAHERYLLLIQLLQEEHAIIEKALKPYPESLQKYKKEFMKNIENYLKINVSTERKKYKLIFPSLKLDL